MSVLQSRRVGVDVLTNPVKMLRNPNYVYGPNDQKVPVNLNLGEHILKTCFEHENRVAFIDAETEQKINFGDIAQNAMSLAVSLTRMGVKKGEVIAIFSENRREFWPTFIGSVCTGAVTTPISLAYNNEELKHTLNISKPKYIFCSPLAYKIHRMIIMSHPFIKKVILYGDHKISKEILYNDLISKPVNKEDFMPVDVVGQNDTVVILYSSGTTGLPKGVMITHYNGVVLCALYKSPEPQPEVVSVSLAPWYHAFGLWSNIVGMMDGRTKVFMKKFNEKLFLEVIQKYRPSSLSVVPPVVVMLSKSQILSQYDVSSVEIMTCGAAPLDKNTIDTVKKRFPNLKAVCQGYGLTESTLVVSKEFENSFDPSKQGSVGCIVPATTVKVVELDTGKVLGPNQPGEICVKGSLIMKGYVGKDRKEDFDDEGFYKTGDVGYYDNDKYFYIVDRLKELIKYKGYQVPPAEIEAELIKHPAVKDAGVIGLPDRAAGELPLAFVVKQPGETITAQEIKEYIASKLSNPKHLRGGIIFVNEIPKNPSGKILRRKLKEELKRAKSKL